MEYAKKLHWETYLESLTKADKWGAAKMVRRGFSDGGAVQVPELEVKDENGRTTRLTANVDKAEAFKAAFFPDAPGVLLVPEGAVYPKEAWSFRPPMNHQFANAIKRMKPYKATRPGSIPNVLFLKANEFIIPHLGPIYRATFTLRYFPDDWVLNQTIVIRKPGKTNYKLPGSSRPVVLSKGHACIVHSTVAEDVVKQGELHGLFPPLQFG
ncbi:hypothetical protein BT96DRAFT_821076, partial [Gymnopus androsaceus JB14]